MTSPQMGRGDEHLQQLRPITLRERPEALLQEAPTPELSYAGFLDRVVFFTPCRFISCPQRTPAAILHVLRSPRPLPPAG